MEASADVNDSLERRNAHRVPCRFVAEDVTEEGAHLPCEATNISETGLYLRRKAGGALEVGSTVLIELRLPEGKECIWAVGEVVEPVEEVFHDAASVTFRAMAEGDRIRIRQYVEHSRLVHLRRVLHGVSHLL